MKRWQIAETLYGFRYGSLSLADAVDMIAQGIEAGTDETLQAAQPEGQEPGGVAMRPDTVTPSSQDTDQ